MSKWKPAASSKLVRAGGLVTRGPEARSAEGVRAGGECPGRAAARGAKRSGEHERGSCERGDSNPAETIPNDHESRGLAVVSVS